MGEGCWGWCRERVWGRSVGEGCQVHGSRSKGGSMGRAGVGVWGKDGVWERWYKVMDDRSLQAALILFLECHQKGT